MPEKTVSQLKSEEVEFLCNVSFEAFKIPFYFVDQHDEIRYSCSNHNLRNPMYDNRGAIFGLLLHDRSAEDAPVILTTEFSESFFSIPIKSNGIRLGSIIAGPVIYTEVSDSSLDSLLTELPLSVKQKRELLKYFSYCPVKDYHTLVNIITYVYYAISGIRLEPGSIVNFSNAVDLKDNTVSRKAHHALSQQRLTGTFHNTMANEKLLMQCVKEGNVEKAMKLSFLPDGNAGELARDNPLRSVKNNAVIFVAVVSRAAIEGGLDCELAFTLGDQYSQQIEDLSSIQRINELCVSMLLDFTGRVKAGKSMNCSKTIARCQEYIRMHVYENIKLSDLASHVKLNVNYLSELFRKETGTTILHYIHVQKIEEAKKLMDFTDNSLLEISTQLNFCNQSHFTRIFRQIEGVAPSRYRTGF